VRTIAFLFVLLCGASVAGAQPITFRLKAQVSVGQKPQLELKANEPVTGVKVELVRADGKKFGQAPGALAKGAVVMVNIGDGAAGTTKWTGSIAGTAAGGAFREQLDFQTAVLAPIKVSYDIDHLDLDKRVLQFRVSRAIDKAELVVVGDDGKELAKATATYQPQPADAWLPISWTQPANTRVLKLVLRVAAADGMATNVELVPWSVEVEHEDVNFPTDKATIEASETAKLDAALAKIADVVKKSDRFVKMQLYVAGHTDTVGPNAKNLTLSVNRAVAIAKYFREHGLAIPIAFAGFGEEVLKAKTADNVDERVNRRADYVLGPVGGTPPFKGPYLKVRAAWKVLPAK